MSRCTEIAEDAGKNGSKFVPDLNAKVAPLGDRFPRLIRGSLQHVSP